MQHVESQSQRTTYCVIPFTASAANKQMYRVRKISGCLGLWKMREGG